MEFSKQEYWSEYPLPPPGDLSDTGIEPECPALQADSLPFEPPYTDGHWVHEQVLNCSLSIREVQTKISVSYYCKNLEMT